MLNTLESLSFDNRSTRELPADPIEGSARRELKNACYSRVQPTPVRAPQLVAYSAEVARDLGLDPGECESAAFADVFTGNRFLDGMDPHATCYGGHQFGNWAGQLGDGRAINLGEVAGAQGLTMLQLKGAGETPYSRTADGLAVLRSSVREFLCSEAMHHLGVPTTRALSLTLTGEQVVRDMLYDGHPAPEPGAVVCRTAPSFTRFGHFEILAARGETDLLKQFTDFTIRTQFPDLVGQTGQIDADVYARWFQEVCDRTARMIVEWMRVGFVHGVMNTDNMSILGLTIDYGPYGWLDNYDPEWTPNTTDAGGRRYRFAHQPAVGQWNLLQLANAIYPLIEQAEPLEGALKGYQASYTQGWQRMMAAKLGLQEDQGQADQTLFESLGATLQLEETDMTIFYRRLAAIDVRSAAPEQMLNGLNDAFYDPSNMGGANRQTWLDWLTRYQARAIDENYDPQERSARMNAVNPMLVLRNYMAQLAIDAAEQGDFSLIHDLQELIKRPYDDDGETRRWAGKRPDWARTRVGCSQLSCSS
jgi:uncharacterized protein YdiU (UPF0061 family)